MAPTDPAPRPGDADDADDLDWDEIAQAFSTPVTHGSHRDPVPDLRPPAASAAAAAAGTTAAGLTARVERPWSVWLPHELEDAAAETPPSAAARARAASAAAAAAAAAADTTDAADIDAAENAFAPGGAQTGAMTPGTAAAQAAIGGPPARARPGVRPSVIPPPPAYAPAIPPVPTVAATAATTAPRPPAPLTPPTPPTPSAAAAAATPSSTAWLPPALAVNTLAEAAAARSPRRNTSGINAASGTGGLPPPPSIHDHGQPQLPRLQPVSAHLSRAPASAPATDGGLSAGTADRDAEPRPTSAFATPAEKSPQAYPASITGFFWELLGFGGGARDAAAAGGPAPGGDAAGRRRRSTPSPTARQARPRSPFKAHVHPRCSMPTRLHPDAAAPLSPRPPSSAGSASGRGGGGRRGASASAGSGSSAGSAGGVGGEGGLNPFLECALRRAAMDADVLPPSRIPATRSPVEEDDGAAESSSRGAAAAAIAAAAGTGRPSRAGPPRTQRSSPAFFQAPDEAGAAAESATAPRAAPAICASPTVADAAADPLSPMADGPRTTKAAPATAGTAAAAAAAAAASGSGASLPPAVPTYQSWTDGVDDPFQADARPLIKLVDRRRDVDGVVTPALAEAVRPHLPPLLQEAAVWRLVYSLEQHGVSLRTLYTKVQDQGPTFLALADGEGRLLGAFVSDDVHVDAVHYYGNGSTFVWSCPAADPWAVQAYHATGANTYLVLTTPTFMAFGGGEGRFGLWLDAELYNGHSGPCQTFNNKQLSTQAEFVCERLEVWSFQI